MIKSKLRNPTICSFVLFSILLVTIYVNSPGSSGDLTIFLMSFISLFDITIAVVPDPTIFILLYDSAVKAATVDPDGINTLFANGWSTFYINGKPAFNNVPRSLSTNKSTRLFYFEYLGL